jgi:hypothetical protein
MPKEINITDKKKFEKKALEKAQPSPIEEEVPLVKEEAKPNTEAISETSSTPIEKDMKKGDKKDKEAKKEKKPKKERKPMKKWVLISLIAGGVLLVAGGLFAFYYFGIFRFVKDPSEVTTFPTDYLKPSSTLTLIQEDIIELSQPDEPRTEESPLNGELFTLDEMAEMLNRRPVAAMINNHVVARPQSGLNSADIVFEALVESGITRYMAIFWSEAPEKIGPIRSARNYYLQWLNPLDALYIHDGCAMSDNPEANACGNLYNYGIKDLGTTGSWRWDDGVRYAPHNEYNSVTNAWEYAANLDWDEFPEVESWSFKRDALPENRGEEGDVEIAFHTRLDNGGAYDVKWTYDPDTNTYLRRIGGQIDIDQETDTQVWAKNVIIQEVETAPAYDETAHIVITTIDTGDATFLIDGKVIEGTWEKKSRTDRTTYYDGDGKEIQFNRGRIWIEAVSTDDGRFDIIEQ